MMNRKERKELEREVRRLYFAYQNIENLAKAFGEALGLLDEIEKTSNLGELWRARKRVEDMYRFASDVITDLADGDVARAFLKTYTESPQDRRIHFVARQMESLN